MTPLVGAVCLAIDSSYTTYRTYRLCRPHTETATGNEPMMRLLITFVLAIALAPQSPAAAQEAASEVISGGRLLDWTARGENLGKPRKFYLGRRVAPTMSYAGGASWLVRPEREAEERSSEMIAQLRLKPGMVVADFGSGVGYHSIPMAQAVAPDGKVYAIDLQEKMLRSLVARAEEAGVESIAPVLTRSNVPDLPLNKFDLVLMVDVYHELSYPAETLREIRGSLRPGGLVALVEFRGEDPDVPILPEHKMTKEQILKEYKANGFTLKDSYDGLPWQHLMFFAADQSQAVQE